MKTILLTGATGYIGKRAIQFLLEHDFVVYATTSKKLLPENSKHLFWQCIDLLDPNQTEELIAETRPSYLLHLAWYVEHGKFWNAPENLKWARASLNLIELFAKYGGQRVVAAGTCAEYDWSESGVFNEQTSALRPLTLYGASKHGFYLIAGKFAETVNLSFAWGRIFFPFGFDEPPNRLIPSVARALLKNEPAKCSHGEQIRDFMFVEDTAAAFVALLDSEVKGAVNIASGNGVKIKAVVESIAEIIGRKELLQIGALPASPNEPPILVGDVNRLRKEVNFYQKNNLQLNLARTVNFWKNKTF